MKIVNTFYAYQHLYYDSYLNFKKRQTIRVKMNKHVLFIQGGEEDHAADAKLVASLQEALEKEYVVHYPLLTNTAEPDFGRIKQIGDAISLIKEELILVGHSLGASMLLKYLSVAEVKKKITGIFATPFWSGDEDWKRALKLQDNFVDKLQKKRSDFSLS